MFSEAELVSAIEELTEGRHTIQNCEKLAAIFTVLDHLHPQEKKEAEPILTGASYQAAPDKVPDLGDSEFFRVAEGKSTRSVLLLVDELAEAVRVLNPKLYADFIDRLISI